VATFLDVYTLSLNKKGEELCGDTVKIFKTDQKTTLVLSDGLGSGVKANILATLTASIIVTMLRQNAPLKDVISTVIGTLPMDQSRRIAYATFTIVEIDHATSTFRVTNFDNPPAFYLKQGVIQSLPVRIENILGKKIKFSEGTLEKGDFLGVISDGVLYAGLGITMNFGWGWKNVAAFMTGLFSRRIFTARSVVDGVIAKTRALYGGEIGDDATFAGILARTRNDVMVFTGPPLDNGHDYDHVNRLLQFGGRKIICGGTTANIVAQYLKTEVVSDISTLREEIPPIGRLPGIDLVTEGIITMARALEYVKNSDDDLANIPDDRNGAVMLARELLLADAIHFLVGQSISAFYQNPLLPKNISIRRTLIEQLAETLRRMNKDVYVDYC